MLRYSGVPKEHPDVNDMTTSASIESSMERSQSILFRFELVCLAYHLRA